MELLSYSQSRNKQIQYHYPYGMMMPDRDWSSESSYRFGFNGKEVYNEIAGNGNIYDYGFRVYNHRIGKFLSVDPLFSAFPWYTPYQYASNSPVSFIDIDGLEGIHVVNDWKSDLRQQILVKQDIGVIKDLPLGTFIATEYPDASSVLSHTYKRTVAPSPSQFGKT